METTRHFLTIPDFTREELLEILHAADYIKKEPRSKYEDLLKTKTLLMLFEKPSLRTRVSFECAMTEFGGHGIYYDISTSPLGKVGKETIEDTAAVLSEYACCIMARLKSKEQMHKLAKNSTVPCINGLDDWGHPAQITCDLLTILEYRGGFESLKFAYLGDAHNNVTYDHMRAAALLGYECRVGCPEGAEYSPDPEVVAECAKLCETSGGRIIITHDAVKAVDGVDVVYTDSWMSYHIPEDQKAARRAKFMPYQVTAELMKHAKPNAIFMNCLPAMRGNEQTAEVIDGPQSVVFKQAGNRLHAQKAIILFLLGMLPEVVPDSKRRKLN